MASIEIGTVATNSFEVRVIDLPTGYAKFLRWHLDGSEKYITGAKPDESKSEWEEFTDLSPNTSYILRVDVEDLNGTKVDEIEEEITTKSESSSSKRPDEFTWKDGTKKKQSKKPFDITAKEWGNLLDNINAVREYKGYSAISSTSNADAIARFYYPSKGDNFLASMYNQCIYAFEDMELLDYSSYRVLKGDPITADAINFLVKTINSVE